MTNFKYNPKNTFIQQKHTIYTQNNIFIIYILNTFSFGSFLQDFGIHHFPNFFQFTKSSYTNTNPLSVKQNCSRQYSKFLSLFFRENMT